MFGKSHEAVGTTTSDLILKTRGKIKIQWGNKFIDLLKDGKINVNSDFIFKVANKESIKNKSGVYITDNGEVYLKYSSDEPLNLLGEIGTSYVSFLAPQETTSDNKYTALKNIGLIYPSLEDIDETSLQNGIIYVEDALKLYIIKNGELSEFSFKLPNPYTELFVISKNDSSQGALYIMGVGINNSIAFNSLYLYETDSEAIIQSKKPLNISSNTNTLNITSEQTIFNKPIIANRLESLNATSNTGFRLYTIGNSSILEVDRVIERNPIDSDTMLYPEYWLLNNNIISSIENDNTLNLLYKHNYKVGDVLKLFIKNITETQEDTEETESEEITEDDFTEYKMIVTDVIDEKQITVDTSLPETVTSNIQIFLVSSAEKSPIRIVENNVDIITNDAIHSRYGNLTELQLKRKDNNSGTVEIMDSGVYSQCGVFKESLYSDDYVLASDDNSSRFASTEWIVAKNYVTKSELENLPSEIPQGSIIMFNGDLDIPEKWAICDGTNGTPNLSDLFITSETYNIIYIIKK